MQPDVFHKTFASESKRRIFLPGRFKPDTHQSPYSKGVPCSKPPFFDFNFPGAISFTYTFCNVQILPIHATSDFK